MATQAEILQAILKELQAQREGTPSPAPPELDRGPGAPEVGVTFEEAETARKASIKQIQEMTEKLTELRTETAKTSDTFIEMHESIDKSFSVDEMNSRIDNIEAQKKAMEDLAEAQRIYTEELRDAADDADAKAAAKAKLTTATNDYTAALKRNAAQAKETKEKLGAEKGLTKELDKVFASMTGGGIKTGGLMDKMRGLQKQFGKAKASGGSFGKVMGRFAKGAILGRLAKGADALVNATFDLAKAQDKAISAFKKATGAGKQYNLEITKLQRTTQAAGVTAADAGKTFGTLFESFSAFTQLSEKERATLGETSALLSKLGVDAGSSAKIMDQMTRSLGMSAEGTNDILLRLAGNAKALGVSMKKMAADFAGAFKELAKYGDNAIDVFEGLSKQAKATGISVGNLLGLAKKFDTFDSAATSVGKLNAILGGPYLNSIDMLNATEEERIDLLRQTVDASGVQFEAMKRFEKQAIASAMGMSVEDASRIMKMNTAEMRLQSLQQEELAELAADSQEIMEKLKNAFRTLLVDMRPLIETVIIPVLDFFGGIAKFFGDAEGAMGKFIKVGLLAAGIAAVIGAPFTGGASLVTYAAIAGTAGIAAFGGGAVDKAASRKVKGYASGTNRGQTVGDYFSSNPIKMNELGPEKAIMDANAFVPDNTIIQSHAALQREADRGSDTNKLLGQILNKLGDQKFSVSVGGHEFEEFATKTFDAGAASQNVGNPYRRD